MYKYIVIVCNARFFDAYIKFIIFMAKDSYLYAVTALSILLFNCCKQARISHLENLLVCILKNISVEVYKINGQ